jgi:hypothetical protein
MIQTFPKQHGINQGLALAVINIQTANVFTFNDEGHQPAVIVLDVDPGQPAAIA